ncbi:MAG: hypothetical protein E7188_02560 [Erysipelotrichaceae bacterium]|nr:hypothetical protein [Erysipelotrichaceae bacterium]
MRETYTTQNASIDTTAALDALTEIEVLANIANCVITASNTPVLNPTIADEIGLYIEKAMLTTVSNIREALTGNGGDHQ